MAIRVFKVKFTGVYDGFRSDGQIFDAIDRPGDRGRLTLRVPPDSGWKATIRGEFPESWLGKQCYNVPKRMCEIINNPLGGLYDT